MEQNHTTEQLMSDREGVIIRTSVIGIIANILLSAGKAAVGLISHSIAVALDAVNNLTDALSSIVTIIGTKLAAKKPDKKHPLGYGRIEYLSAMVVSAIVLYAGFNSLEESIKKVIHPEDAEYSNVSLIIIASSVLVKLLLGRYVKSRGEAVNSESLKDSGTDALLDAILSSSVLASAVIFRIWGISLEAYVGIGISAVIIKSGFEMMMGPLNDILGQRADRELVKEIRKTICEDEAVSGAYDLILHSYGPEKNYGSVHVEVPDTMTAEQIDQMERRITQNVFLKHGVIMTGISIYSVNTTDEAVKEIRTKIFRIISAHEGVLQIHGFYADTEKKQISLDVILDFALDEREKVFCAIRDEVQEAYPDYHLQMTMDIDV